MSVNLENNPAALLLDCTAQHPDKPLYLFGARVLSHGEVAENCYRFANFLRSRGLQPGERVVLALPDTPAFPAAFLGVMLCGGVPMVLNAELPLETVVAVLAETQASLLITTEALPAAAAASAVRHIFCDDFGPAKASELATDFTPVQSDPEAIGYMLFTSGSTGLPKAVAHRNASLLRAAALAVQALEINPDDLLYCIAKFSFVYGFSLAMTVPLLLGATAVLAPGRPTPAAVFDLLGRYRPTLFYGVPTLYAQLLRAWTPSVRLERLRYCYSTGETLPSAVSEEWRRVTGGTIIEGLGSTEAGLPFITTPPDAVRPGSVGVPIPSFELRLVDDAGVLLPASSGPITGHLQARGPTFAICYWNRPEATARTMLADGWVRTGDIVELRDGYYYHLGRSDDMMKVGGEWVAPQRIEAALLQHPRVGECAVVARQVAGLPRPWAFIVLRPGDEEHKDLARGLRGFVATKLPMYMCPAGFEFVPELPKTFSGKVQRYKLRLQTVGELSF